MKKVLKWLEGKKTLMIAALVGLLTVAEYLGWLTPEAYMTLMGLCGAGGLATLRLGLKSKK